MANRKFQKQRLKILGSLFLALSFSSQANAVTFEEALISAYNSNPVLLSERARLREIDETYIQARAQGRLTSSASADTGFLDSKLSQTSVFGGDSVTSENLKPHSATIQFNQPLYQGGRVSALKKQTKIGILAARENLRAIEQNILLSAATAYADVIRDEEIALIRRRNIRVLDKLEVASRERFRLKDGTRTDVAQSQSRIAGAEIGLAQADAQLSSSRAFFVETIGYMPSELSNVPDFDLPSNVEEAKRMARENNPDLYAARLNEKAGEAAIKVAKSAHRPTISINGSYQVSEAQSTTVNESENTSIVAQLTIPIFTGGLNSSQVREAEHARTRFSFETRAAERALDRQVADLWGQLDATHRSLKASQAQVKFAEDALKGVELEKTVGTRTTLDVLDAEEELLNAELTVVQAQRNLDVISFQFLSILGVFDARSLGLSSDYHDPAENFEFVVHKGQDALIDAIVPEAVQKIGKQIPDIPKDISNVISETGIPGALKTDVKNLVQHTKNTGTVVKEVVDTITFQKPVYGPIEIIDETP